MARDISIKKIAAPKSMCATLLCVYFYILSVYKTKYYMGKVKKLKIVIIQISMVKTLIKITIINIGGLLDSYGNFSRALFRTIYILFCRDKLFENRVITQFLREHFKET